MDLQYIAGTQLLAGQVETQIPCGQPDFALRVIDGGISVTGVCEVLVSSHCLLEMDMS